MVMMALLPPGGLLGGYGADPDGVNGSWEEACTCVSTSIRVRVAVARPVIILATSHRDFSSLAHAPRAWLARCQATAHES